MNTADYQRKYWAEHPEYRKRCADEKKRRRLELIEWVRQYLVQHPCVDCCEKDLVVLEFDHVRGRKSRDVMGLLNGSLERLEAEIAKCDVVCANCHTRRTAQRLSGYRWGWRNIGN